MMIRVSRLCKNVSKIKSTVQNRMVKDKAVSDKLKLVCEWPYILISQQSST
jgi:hypothetical protein